jgi:hypothetical protein
MRGMRQWRSVRQHLDTVEADCRPGAYRGNEPVRLHFENFFTQCFHLGDWLREDKSTGLIRQAGARLHRERFGIAHMRWHGQHEQAPYPEPSERSDSEDRQRHVGPNGTRVSIVWSRVSDSGTEDALDLARRCGLGRLSQDQ